MSDRNAIFRGGENIHNEYEFEFEWEHAVAFIPVVVIIIIIIHPAICNPSIELCLVLVSHKSFDGRMIKCFVLRSAAPQDLQLLLYLRITRPYIAKIRSNNSPPFAISLQPIPNQKHRFLWSGGFAFALWLLIVLSSFLLFPAYVSLNVFAQTISKDIYFWQNICQCISKTYHESCHIFRGWFRKSLWVTQWDD